MVKVFTTNKNGKIEFTKQELEKLLNEIWNNGYSDGYNANKSYWWSSPTITTPYYTTTSTCTAPTTGTIKVQAND